MVSGDFGLAYSFDMPARGMPGLGHELDVACLEVRGGEALGIVPSIFRHADKGVDDGFGGNPLRSMEEIDPLVNEGDACRAVVGSEASRAAVCRAQEAAASASSSRTSQRSSASSSFSCSFASSSVFEANRSGFLL